MSDENEPKIIVDDDYKSQVEAEKEALRKKEEEDAKNEPEQNLFPEASFSSHLSMLATQAIAALGQLPDPASGKPTINKPFAKHIIDTISVLEEKTKGNLTDEESQMLDSLLHQLRMAYMSAPNKMPEAEEKEKSSTIELP